MRDRRRVRRSDRTRTGSARHKILPAVFCSSRPEEHTSGHELFGVQDLQDPWDFLRVVLGVWIVHDFSGHTAANSPEVYLYVGHMPLFPRLIAHH